MKELILTKKAILKIGFKGGNATPATCTNKDLLRKVISEALYQSLTLYTRETPENNVKIMVHDILETYEHDSIDVITSAIKDIRTGKYKVYGLVTPNNIREAMIPYLEEQSIELERIHERNKGYSAQEAR